MIRAVADAFGDRADELVFIGGCVLSLYRGPSTAALRPTTDVDCLSGMQPWSRQEAMLADLCQTRRLAPDPSMQFRYRIEGTGFDVDVLSPDGANVPTRLSSKDAEDVVALLVEVPTLVDEVIAERIAPEIAALWTTIFAKYRMTQDDLPDLVDAHLHREDRPQRGRVLDVILRLATG